MDTGGSPRCQETMGGTSAQIRSERVLEQPNEPPLTKGHTSRSEEGRIEHIVELMDTVPPTPYDSPLTGGYTPESDEENELSSTKDVYHKAFITLTKRVKKLETQLKQKRSRAVIYSSDEEEPSVDIKDSTKQGRMIEELDKDEDANLLYAEELAKETARQEQEKYNLEKALKLQRKLDKREEDVDKGDQNKEIDWNYPIVLRYHALQNRPFSKAEVKKNVCMYLKNQEGYKQSYFKGMKSGFHLQEESSKKQKLDHQTKDEEEEVEAQVDSDQEVEEMKLYMRTVPDEDIAIDVIPLATKPQ
nr:hypothetical protein [Tanacetum cinerariifolium]